MLHLPSGGVSSSAVEAIELAASAGLFLDDWQRWVLTEALAERVDGKWSAFEVALLVPRQNGKNAVLEALELAAIYTFGERLVIHSAHRVDTSLEHFLRMKSLIEETPDLDRKVAPNGFVTANGKEAIKFRNGARIKFVARARGSGRGFSGDRIVLDEAYDLPPKVIGAMLPTLSTRPNAQVWYASSAPHADSSVLHTLRRRAADPTDADRRLFYAEWGTDPDCDPADRDQWFAANPALGIRISEEYVENEFRAMMDMPEEFSRERLGIPDGIDGPSGVIPIGLWDSLIAPYDMPETGRRVALDVSADGRWSSICAAQDDDDGVSHLEVVDRREGTDWLAPRAAEVCKKFGLSMSVPMNGPAVAQVPLLKTLGVDVVEVGATDVMRAAAGFVDACTNRKVRHLGNVSMRNAITGAAVKTVGDLTKWGRATSTADISPLVAASVALASNVPLVFAY